MMLYVMAFGWLFSSLIFFAGPGLGDIGQLTPRGWAGVAFLGLVSASQVGALLYLEPLVTIVVAAALLGEPLVWVTLLGGLVILLGVALVQAPARPVSQE
jgi:drug/metabolite transporter (DMT)-like permease